MKDNQVAFFDTNILVYRVYGTAEQKQNVLRVLQNLSSSAIVSKQVLKEFTNVSIKKKLHKSQEELKLHLSKTTDSFNVSEITLETIFEALDLIEQYHYSFYDSLIIATALENKCNILYSEDMQHGQIIRKKLKIINPFK
jgi:predicted nucleic acid-binding protein